MFPATFAVRRVVQADATVAGVCRPRVVRRGRPYGDRLTLIAFKPTTTELPVADAARQEPTWEPSAVDCSGRMWTPVRSLRTTRGGSITRLRENDVASGLEPSKRLVCAAWEAPDIPRHGPTALGRDHSVALVYRRLETSWWAVRGVDGSRRTTSPVKGVADITENALGRLMRGEAWGGAAHHHPPRTGTQLPTSGAGSTTSRDLLALSAAVRLTAPISRFLSSAASSLCTVVRVHIPISTA